MEVLVLYGTGRLAMAMGWMGGWMDNGEVGSVRRGLG